MTLPPDTELLHYRLQQKLGEGGMGVVYRAVDTSLDRSVAIKLLPEVLSAQTDRLERFEREARTLASLNHPNIATIHGLHEAQDPEGNPVRFLAMELVDGEDLADRIGRGPIPLDETVEIGSAIAAGLSAAHLNGIVHRDLKPANVRLTPDGRVKVLDFGLAKAFLPGEASGSGPVGAVSSGSGAMAPTLADSPALADSPTMTSTGTQAGMIMGTAAYMSPEQARGRPVDKRTDVFAFGCVLYEMLTGKQAFGGETLSDTLAAILKDEPDLDALPSMPGGARRALLRCLRKNPDERTHDIADVRIQLSEALAAGEEESEPGAAVSARSGLPWWLALVGGLAVTGLIIAVIVLSTQVAREAPPEPTTRLTVDTPFDFSETFVQQVVWSPDGRELIFTRFPEREGESSVLMRRRLDRLKPSAIPGTEGGMFPFLSPDGAWIGFTREGSIYKMPAQGGPVVRLASFDRFVFGTAWAGNGTIYFSTLDPGRNRGTLMQVPDSGGEARPLFDLGEDERDNDFGFPVLLPGEQGLLYLKASLNAGLSPENVVVEHFAFAGTERKVLMEKVTFPRWVNSGHIVAVDAEGSIVAQPFDPVAVELNGPAVTLPTQVRLLSGWLPALSVSSGGSLFYVEGQRKVEEELLWMSEDGSTTAAGSDFAPFGDVVLSPDGSKVAYTVVEAQTSTLMVEDLRRRTRTAVDREGWSPAWTPDSRELVYSQLLEGDSARGQLLIRSADGRGEPRALARRPFAPFPLSVSTDGTLALFKERDASTGALQLWEVPLAGGEPRRVEEATGTVMAAAYSPDGRWLAYQSDREGGFRIYLRSLEPGAGADMAVSGDGALWPMWGANGRTLDFVTRDPISIQRVRLDENGVSAAARTLLTPNDSQAVDLRIYNVADDGRWLVTRRAGGDLADRQVIVLGWDEELRSLAPAN